MQESKIKIKRERELKREKEKAIASGLPGKHAIA